MDNPEFSIIVPIYNEEENIPELYSRLTQVLEKLCEAEGISLGSFEIVMVDDGSRDRSWQLISDLHGIDPRVKGLSFSRNFGHHIAITAGLDHARGQAVVLMDGDLQDPPEEIPKLYAKLKEGYDLVYGVRMERRDNLFRKVSSYLFWKTIRHFSGFDIPENQSMLRIMTKQYLDSFRMITERNRFLAGLFAWTGFRQVSVAIEHSPRFAGKSKYNLWRMIKLTFNAITSFSFFPLQMAGLAGVVISLFSFLVGLLLIFKKIFSNIYIAGWTSTMVLILFMGGVQLVVLGLIGEYLGRVFSEVQQRPMYFVKESLK